MTVSKRNKYGAIKTTINGEKFDSKGEARYWLVLQDRLRKGEIMNLKRQIRFPLEVNGKKVCDYIADFTYTENGVFVVDDYKGKVTDLFRIKAKLFEVIYGYKIRITKK